MAAGLLERSLKRVTAVAAVALLAGCGSDDEGAGCVAPQACDISQESCQQAVFAATACERRQEGVAMPPIRVQSVSEYRRERTEALDDDSSDSFDAWETALHLLRFVPDEKNVQAAYVDVQAAWVAAYYSHETQRITILDRGGSDPVQDVFLLSHEFVHALQDAAVGLKEFIPAHAESTDSNLAVRGLVEGEAMVVSYAVMERARGRAPAASDWWSFSSRVMNATTLELAGAESRFLQGYQSLPYAYGFAALYGPWIQDEGRQLDAYYAEPPRSLADLARNSAVGYTRVEPLDCYPTDPPEGFAADDHDTFGLLGALAMPSAAVDRPGIELYWRGDSVVIFRSTSAAESFAVSWTVRWSTELFAETFARRATTDVPGARVLQRGLEVDVLVATDAAVLAGWQPACGTADALPKSSQSASGAESSGRGGLARLLERARF